tara:strand:- start:245 stop:1891 length:1647 start_codon:yes stop_codon:yes gene_type:complete
MTLTKAHNRMIAGASFNVKDYGAIGDGVADDIAAFNATRDAAGTNGTWVVPAGNYDLSSPLSLTYAGQTVIMEGVTLNNGITIELPNINIFGRPIIDPSAFGSRTPFFGVLSVYAQDRSTLDIRVFNVDGAAYISGNTYRGQVAVGNTFIYSENCGLVASHSHGLAGIIGYSKSSVPSTLSTITNAGSGYTNGRWIVPATNISSSGSGAILALDVSGGAVSNVFVLNGGKGYATSDTVGFNIAGTVNNSQGSMSAGSGFVFTVGDVMDAKTWFNENNFTLATNGGWFGGILSYGSYNYNSLRLYLEAVWSRTDDLVYIDGGVDNSFDKLSLLVNSNIGETTDRNAKLVSMPNGFGTVVQSGRSGNPFSTSLNPLVDLFDFGLRTTTSFDAFSSLVATRGNEYNDFTPTVVVSGVGSDFSATYNTQKGRYREDSGVVDFIVELDFDANAYTISPGNLYVSMSDLVSKIKGNEPNSYITYWPVGIYDIDQFNIPTSAIQLTAYWQNNQNFIRLFWMENSASNVSKNPIGTAEMAASTTGYRIVLRGQIEY